MPKKKKKNPSSADEANMSFDPFEEGFLYKPVSDSGELVILLPSKYRDSQVVLKDSEGNVIEQGRSTGYANGDREHFRFQQSGSKYPNGAIVEVTLADGSTMRHQVEDTSMRIDSGNISSGGSEGGGAGIASLMGSSGGGISSVQKPQIAEKFKARTSQPTNQDLNNFKSPLTTLETIRSVTNIIVGSSKSFDNILSQQLQQQQQQQQQLQNLAPQLSIGGQQQPEEQKPEVMRVPGYNI
jgi:hypothetical protein